MRRVRFAAGITGALLMAAAAGCGGDPDTAEVSGTVLVDSGPAPEETSITFTPTDGVKSPQGCKLKDGKYTPRVPLGVSKVAVVANKQDGVRKVYNTPDSPTAPIYKNVLAAKYHEKTELTYDVKPGRHVHDLDLPSKK